MTILDFLNNTFLHITMFLSTFIHYLFYFILVITSYFQELVMQNHSHAIINTLIIYSLSGGY